MNDPRDRAAMAATLESVVTAIIVVLMIASTISLLAMLTSAVASPRIGDMLLFKSSTAVGAGNVVSAALKPPSGGTGRHCDLDPAIMTQGGGSIVIEKRSVNGDRYLVHWAGSRTALGLQDCGRSAELRLSGSALRSLINALGGRGIAGGGNVF